MRTRDGVNLALKAIGVTGLSGLKVTAPNTLAALGHLLRKSAVAQTDLPKIMRELKRQGLVSISEEKGSISLALTPAGAHRLQAATIEELMIVTPKKWDKKWRLVTFDVPVKFSPQRQRFTQHLESLGFVMLQRSFWVHPFPCFDEIETLASYYNVLRYCAFFEAERTDNLTARRLVRRFQPLLKT